MAPHASVQVQIVSFNSAKFLRMSLEAALAQRGFTPGDNFELHLIDNASTDGGAELAEREFGARIRVHRNRDNLGFCAAHNQGVTRFLQSSHTHLLLLNPDLALHAEALQHLLAGVEREASYGMSTPRLLRADHALQPLEPQILDAAGMHLENSLRHFDRGSGRPAQGLFEDDQEVFGGTGACLLLKRSCVESLLLRAEFDQDVDKFFPALGAQRVERAPLFDEAFFAFREDADLAWRAQILGWRCIYCAKALGYHVRRVTPERRKELPSEINLAGVRNRFLLQLNNYQLFKFPAAIVPGLLFRNALVILACLLYEWASLPALTQVWRLSRRALARRRELFGRAHTQPAVKT